MHTTLKNCPLATTRDKKVPEFIMLRVELNWIDRKTRDLPGSFEIFDHLRKKSSNKTELRRTVKRPELVVVGDGAAVLNIVINIFSSELPARFPIPVIGLAGFK